LGLKENNFMDGELTLAFTSDEFEFAVFDILFESTT
jgi:hypothetical protein